MVLFDCLLNILLLVFVHTLIRLALFQTRTPQTQLQLVELLFDFSHFHEDLLLKRPVAGL